MITLPLAGFKVGIRIQDNQVKKLLGFIFGNNSSCHDRLQTGDSQKLIKDD
jgi:hypothetical protein